MIVQTLQGRQAFIRENTRLQAPPHTPELSLHLADEVTPIWKLTEEALQEIGPITLGNLADFVSGADCANRVRPV